MTASSDLSVDGDWEQRSWRYPERANEAASWIIEEAQRARDTFFCVHLLKTPRNRRKTNAVEHVRALWLDEDEGTYPEIGPEPTATVRSSSQRRHAYWRLTRPVAIEWAVSMNRRLAVWAGGDTGKAGAASVLRAPGTANYKRHPQVDLVIGEFTGQKEWDPEVLDQAVPEIPKPSSPARTEPYDGPEIDLAPYLERVEVLGEVADETSTKFAIVCPWIQEHSGGDRTGTRVGQRANGACWFHCDHQHCQGRSWKDFKKKVLLGLRTKIRRPGYTGDMEVTIYHG